MVEILAVEDGQESIVKAKSVKDFIAEKRFAYFHSMNPEKAIELTEHYLGLMQPPADFEGFKFRTSDGTKQIQILLVG